MPFEPGKSGNPGGRAPEGAMEKEVKRLAKEKSPEAIARLVEWMKSDNPKASVSACNAILDRAFGKPKQELDHGITGGLADLLNAVDGRTRGIPPSG